jgi:hypothetical protein
MDEHAARGYRPHCRCDTPDNLRPAVTAPLSASRAPTIFQYWDSGVPPADLEDLFGSFRQHNPDFHHRVFSESEAQSFIESRFGQRERDAFRACAIPAMQADYFRYCAVLAMGGVYVDVDYRCLKPLRPLLDECEGGVAFMRPNPYTAKGLEAKRVLNGFFAFRQPGHPFLGLTLEIATANMEARIAERVWGVGENVRASIWLTVGPGIFTLIRFLYNWGSFDALRERVPGTPVEPFCDLLCEVIGDYDRVVEACEGMRFGSFEEMLTWIDHPTGPLAYKDTDRHWHNVTTAIFR